MPKVHKTRGHKTRGRRTRGRRTRGRKSHKRASRHRRYRGGYASLAEAFPVTTWGQWNSLPGSTLWGPSQEAPPPLANGGLYTAPQSTGEWASKPMPATQYAFAAEAAKTSGLNEVFYQQRPITQPGTSWSPFVGQTISPNHWSARLPYGVHS